MDQKTSVHDELCSIRQQLDRIEVEVGRKGDSTSRMQPEINWTTNLTGNDGPYGDVIGSVNLGLANQRIPSLNGALLTNDAGTVWMVVNGVARGYTSWDLLMRHHDLYPYGLNPIEDNTDWLNRRIFGSNTVHGQDIKRYFTRIQSINFIEQGAHWSESTGLIYYKNGPLAIYDFVNGTPMIYGVPSKRCAIAHKLAESKARSVSREEFSSYRQEILELPTK